MALPRDASADLTALVGAKYVCCTGAGLKGVCYVGMLRALEDHFARVTGGTWKDHVRDNVRGIAGSSAGALLALTISLGLSSASCMELMQPLFDNVRNLLPNPDVGVLWRSYGLDRGEVLRSMIASALQMAGLSADITLGCMHALTQRDFCCTGTNLHTSEPCVFHHTTHPDMRVLDAVFISACVPILFAPVEYNGDLYVDGSLTCNLPTKYPIEETLVFGVERTPRNRISQWPGYLNAIVMLGPGAQRAREDESLARAACCVTVALPARLRDMPPMDMNMDASTYLHYYHLGYAEMVGRLRGVVLRDVVVALLHAATACEASALQMFDEGGRRDDPDTQTGT